jgi:hypothetical protein
MNLQEALRIAKQEMGLKEVPLDPDLKRKVAARVYELCRINRERPRLAKLEEF